MERRGIGSRDGENNELDFKGIGVRIMSGMVVVTLKVVNYPLCVIKKSR